MDMIKVMHRKFIAAATAAVVVIITGALGLINGLLYVKVEDDITALLAVISENEGMAPKTYGSSDDTWFGGGSWNDDAPEFSYQTRYFSVLFDDDGAPRAVNISHIAAFSAGEAVSRAEKIFEGTSPEGRFSKDRGRYAWMVSRRNEGALVVVLDCTREMAALHSFFRYSFLFGLFCTILYALMVTGLSRWAIRPFVRNMESQKRFITNAGHELKTPIAIISANAEALEMMSGKNQWTGNILRQVKRLSGLINDLILLARVGETQASALTLGDVDMTRAARLGEESFRQMIADEGKTFTSHVEEGIRVRGDEKMVGEIVTILMDNAVKYCDDGGTIEMELIRRKKGKGAIFSVANSYAAGKDSDFSRFFERFYRGDVSHNSGKGGYGIGLSMAQEMTRLMKGKMHAAAKDGRIIFSVFLPSP